MDELKGSNEDLRNIRKSHDTDYDEYDEYDEMPMKWYKFMIYISLFLTAGYGFYNSFLILSGSIYDNEKSEKLLCDQFPALYTVNIIFGVSILIIAVLSLITRYKLKKFSKQGPAFVMALYGSSLLLTYLYLVIVSGITGDNLFIEIDGSIFDLINAAVMIILNKIYYSKRAHLFVN